MKLILIIGICLSTFPVDSSRIPRIPEGFPDWNPFTDWYPDITSPGEMPGNVEKIRIKIRLIKQNTSLNDLFHDFK